MTPRHAAGPARYRLPPDRWLIGGLLAVALLIRLVLVIATRHSYTPTHDAADFSRIAAAISHGHGFFHTEIKPITGPSAFRTPLWPAVLGAVYWVFGVSVTSARLVLAVISTGMVALIGAVSWSLLGRRVGLTALAIASVYPPLLLASYGLNYESLMGVTVFGALLCVLQWRKRPGSWWLLVVCGLLSGAAILGRENAGLILIPIVILVWQRLRTQDRSGALTRIGLIVACALVVVTPWTIRNADQLHAFIPVSDSPGIALAGTYNPSSPNFDAAWIPAQVVPAYRHILTDLPKGDNEAQFSEKMQSAALSYLSHHPGYVGEVAFWNTVRLFDLRGPADSNWLAPLIPWPVDFIELSIVSFYAVALVGLFGIVTRRIRGVPWAIWTFPVLWCLSVILTASITQYRYVVEPFFILLAAITVVELFGRSRPDDAEGAAAVRRGRAPAS